MTSTMQSIAVQASTTNMYGCSITSSAGYNGTVVSQIFVLILEHCCRSCQENTRCIVFTYRPGSGDCSLMETLGQEQQSSIPGVISGFPGFETSTSRVTPTQKTSSEFTSNKMLTSTDRDELTTVKATSGPSDQPISPIQSLQPNPVSNALSVTMPESDNHNPVTNQNCCPVDWFRGLDGICYGQLKTIDYKLIKLQSECAQLHPKSVFQIPQTKEQLDAVVDAREKMNIDKKLWIGPAKEFYDNFASANEAGSLAISNGDPDDGNCGNGKGDGNGIGCGSTADDKMCVYIETGGGSTFSEQNCTDSAYALCRLSCQLTTVRKLYSTIGTTWLHYSLTSRDMMSSRSSLGATSTVDEPRADSTSTVASDVITITTVNMRLTTFSTKILDTTQKLTMAASHLQTVSSTVSAEAFTSAQPDKSSNASPSTTAIPGITSNIDPTSAMSASFKSIIDVATSVISPTTSSLESLLSSIKSAHFTPKSTPAFSGMESKNSMTLTTTFGGQQRSESASSILSQNPVSSIQRKTSSIAIITTISKAALTALAGSIASSPVTISQIATSATVSDIDIPETISKIGISATISQIETLSTGIKSKGPFISSVPFGHISTHVQQMQPFEISMTTTTTIAFEKSQITSISDEAATSAAFSHSEDFVTSEIKQDSVITSSFTDPREYMTTLSIPATITFQLDSISSRTEDESTSKSAYIVDLTSNSAVIVSAIVDITSSLRTNADTAFNSAIKIMETSKPVIDIDMMSRTAINDHLTTSRPGIIDTTSYNAVNVYKKTKCEDNGNIKCSAVVAVKTTHNLEVTGKTKSNSVDDTDKTYNFATKDNTAPDSSVNVATTSTIVVNLDSKSSSATNHDTTSNSAVNIEMTSNFAVNVDTISNSTFNIETISRSLLNVTTSSDSVAILNSSGSTSFSDLEPVTRHPGLETEAQITGFQQTNAYNSKTTSVYPVFDNMPPTNSTTTTNLRLHDTAMYANVETITQTDVQTRITTSQLNNLWTTPTDQRSRAVENVYNTSTSTTATLANNFDQQSSETNPSSKLIDRTNILETTFKLERSRNFFATNQHLKSTPQFVDQLTTINIELPDVLTYPENLSENQFRLATKTTPGEELQMTAQQQIYDKTISLLTTVDDHHEILNQRRNQKITFPNNTEGTSLPLDWYTNNGILRAMKDADTEETAMLLDSGIATSKDSISRVSIIGETIPYVLATKYPNLLGQLSANLTDTFGACRFNGEQCNMETDFLTKYHPQYGNCFTFNFNKQKKSHTAGEPYGLAVILEASLDSYICSSTIAGFRVQVHSQDVHPFPESMGLYIPTGAYNAIGFNSLSYNQLSWPHGDCVDDHTTVVDYYEGNHTVEGCTRSCVQRTIDDRCWCSYPIYAAPANATPCDVGQKSCVERTLECKKTIMDKCYCPQACQRTVYEASMTKRTLNKIASMMYCKQHNIPASLCSMSVNKNVAIVSAYFNQIENFVLIERTSYHWIQMLSDVGGSFGIMIGSSAITITEFVMLLFLY